MRRTVQARRQNKTKKKENLRKLFSLENIELNYEKRNSRKSETLPHIEEEGIEMAESLPPKFGTTTGFETPRKRTTLPEPISSFGNLAEL